MAETGFTSGGQSLSGVSRVRNAGSTAPARPSRRMGNQESDFNESLRDTRPLSGNAPDANAVTLQNSPVPGGNALLSTSVLFTLAETRAQEANASRTFPAPSNLGRAIGSYASAEESVRKTVNGAASTLNSVNRIVR